MAQTGARESSPEANVKRTKSEDKLRVYNRSVGRFISLEVDLFDSTVEPLKKLFEFLVHGTDVGLWLTPYRGIPSTQGAKLFDLIYLDEEYKVQEIDTYPNPAFTNLNDEAASALLLPAHTIFVSQIRRGDQLAICASDELESLLHDLDDSSSENPTGPTSSQRQVTKPQSQPTVPETESKKSIVVRAWRWFFPRTPAGYRSNRTPLPGVIVYHWSGGTPVPYHVGNISESGFYLLTDERPYPGTLILMTLQRIGKDNQKITDSIAVYAKVIRWGPDGVGFRFVPVEAKESKNPEPNPGANLKSLNAFVKALSPP